MNIKNITCLTAILSLAFTSCVNDDTDFDIPEDISSSIERVSLDYSSLAENDIFASEYTDDYVENSEFTRTVYIKFNGNDVDITGETSAITADTDGAHVSITPSKKKMLFVLQGSTSDGGVKFYGENKFEVMLDGVTINNPTGPAINSQNKKRMFLVLNDDTDNSLSDGTSYTAYGDEDMKGTIFSEGKILLSGNGKLSVTSNCKHSIASDDYVLIRPGVNVSISNNAGSGIKAKDGATILGGVVNIEVAADGAKGISSDSCIVVRGGRTTVITHGNELIEGTDTTSAACIKCDSAYEQDGGIVRLQSEGSGGKGINAGGDVVISGGSMYAVTFGSKDLSSPKALKTDGCAKIWAETFLYSKASSACDATQGIDIISTLAIKQQNKHLLEVTAAQ